MNILGHIFSSLYISGEPFGIIGLIISLLGLAFIRSRILFASALCALMMYLWRLAYTVHSSRYFISFSIIMIVTTALTGNHIEKRFSDVLRNRWTVHVVRILFCCLIFACFFKTIRINPYQDFVMRAAGSLKSDAAKFDSAVIIDHSKNNRLRMEYYSGLTVIPGDFFQTISSREIDVMSFEAINYLQQYAAVYLAVEDDPRTAEKLTERGFVRIVSVRRSRKARKPFAVYRFDAADGRPHAFLCARGMSVFENGDMENTVPVSAKIPARANMLSSPPALLPHGWIPNFYDGFLPGTLAALGVKEGWSGKAMHLSSRKLITVFCPAQRFAASGEYQLSFQYLASEESRFGIKIYEYSDSGALMRQEFIQKHQSGITSGPKIFRCKFDFGKNRSEKYFILAIQLYYGDICIDNMSLYHSHL